MLTQIRSQFLPLGFDEFYGRGVPVKQETMWTRLVSGVESVLNPTFEKLEKWTEEQKKVGEMNMKLIEKELELVEAELCLEEAIEDEEEELKMMEREEEKKLEEGGLQEEGDIGSPEVTNEVGKDLVLDQVEEDEQEDEEDDEEEDEVAPSSFGSVIDDRKKSNQGKSSFSSTSLSLASSSIITAPGLVSMVPSGLQSMFSSWRKSKSQRGTSSSKRFRPNSLPSCSLIFPHTSIRSLKLKATGQTRHQAREILRCRSLRTPSVRPCKELVYAKPPGYVWPHASADDEMATILSLHLCLETGIQ